MQLYELLRRRTSSHFIVQLFVTQIAKTQKENIDLYCTTVVARLSNVMVYVCSSNWSQFHFVVFFHFWKCAQIYELNILPVKKSEKWRTYENATHYDWLLEGGWGHPVSNGDDHFSKEVFVTVPLAWVIYIHATSVRWYTRSTKKNSVIFHVWSFMTAAQMRGRSYVSLRCMLLVQSPATRTQKCLFLSRLFCR